MKWLIDDDATTPMIFRPEGRRARFGTDHQTGRCPLCGAELVALQGVAGPRWHCSCPPARLPGARHGEGERSGPAAERRMAS
jgi:hypothetical protein